MTLTKEIPFRVEEGMDDGFYRLTVIYPEENSPLKVVRVPALQLPVRNYVLHKNTYLANVFASNERLPIACFRNGLQGMCSIVVHPDAMINKLMVVTYVTDNFSNNPFQPFYRMDVFNRVPHLQEYLISAGVSHPDGQFFLYGSLDGEEFRAHVGWVPPASAQTDRNYQRALRFRVPHEYRWE